MLEDVLNVSKGIVLMSCLIIWTYAVHVFVTNGWNC